jgi:nicotinamidase-related amidase
MSPEARDRWQRRYDIIDEVAPLPGEAVLRKSSPSAFWGTPLAGHLNYLGVDTLITCGESTSGCVRASVVDGCTYRYRMIVVEEGVFDRHEAAHAINLFDMHQKYADVVSLAEVLEYLSAWRARQAWEGPSGPAPTQSRQQPAHVQ